MPTASRLECYQDEREHEELCLSLVRLRIFQAPRLASLSLLRLS